MPWIATKSITLFGKQYAPGEACPAERVGNKANLVKCNLIKYVAEIPKEKTVTITELSVAKILNRAKTADLGTLQEWLEEECNGKNRSTAIAGLTAMIDQTEESTQQ